MTIYTKDNNFSQNNTCIVCKNNLTKENTKVKDNNKYIKYKKIVCFNCFRNYYP